MDHCKRLFGSEYIFAGPHKNQSQLASQAGPHLHRVSVVIKYTFVIGCIVALSAVIINQVHSWVRKQRVAVAKSKANIAQSNAQAAAARAVGCAQGAATCSDAACAAVTTIAKQEAQPTVNGQKIFTKNELEALYPTIINKKYVLIKKHSLFFINTPNAHGLYEGYLKRDSFSFSNGNILKTDIWIKCYVAPTDPTDACHTVWFINEALVEVPKDCTPYLKSIPFHDALVLTDNAFSTVAPLLNKGGCVDIAPALTDIKNASDQARKRQAAHQKEEAATRAKEQQIWQVRQKERLAPLDQALVLFFKDHPGFSPDSSPKESTFWEVYQYLQEKRRQLLEGKDVALPHFFHATGKRDDPTKNTCAYLSIIKKQQLDAEHTLRGYGVCAASYDEAGKEFGSVTFAIDEREIYRQSGCYYYGRARHLAEETYDSLWILRGSDIRITPATVAHIVANDAAACEAIRGRLDKEHPEFAHVPVLRREASRYITHLFDRTGKTHNIPEKDWLWLEGKDLSDVIPGNVKPPSHKQRKSVDNPDDW